ncbi:hypothetical protein BDZ45DRAFT_501356 [Acephala macrosclerotiorum]|nr:hypothetical protein BDZ45DRAFT_501356 [Acephala macrosclerotiorum]
MSTTPSLDHGDDPLSKFGIYIISRGRPANIKKMASHLSGLGVTWVLHPSELTLYTSSGATRTLSGGTLCQSRNAALQHAFSKNLVCVQLSDDLEHVFWWTKNGLERIKITLETATLRTYEIMEKESLFLGGGMPTANAQFASFVQDPEGKGFTRFNFILADFMVIRPTSLRFNETLTLKEDYEFTVQHIKAYGGAVRLLQLMPKFKHYTKKGGCGTYRSAEAELRNIGILKSRHPGWWRKGRNENEVQLVAPKSYRQKEKKKVLERKGTGHECPRPRKGVGVDEAWGCGCEVAVVIPYCTKR